MDHQVFEGHYNKPVVLDLCHDCGGVWFDPRESLQLAPGAVLGLFKSIHDKRSSPRTPLAEKSFCPRCQVALTVTNDIQRSTRFQYLRCPSGHGRFITFFHFLREKNFVRALTGEEIAQVKAKCHTLNCSNCGASVDLNQEMICGYCRTPISMLDPDAVERTMKDLQSADNLRRSGARAVEFVRDRLQADHLGNDPDLNVEDLWRKGLVEIGIDLLVKRFS